MNDVPSGEPDGHVLWRFYYDHPRAGCCVDCAPAGTPISREKYVSRDGKWHPGGEARRTGSPLTPDD
jgi:hypothetical protein